MLHNTKLEKLAGDNHSNLLVPFISARVPHYAECRVLFVVMLNVIMLSVVMLNVMANAEYSQHFILFLTYE